MTDINFVIPISRYTGFTVESIVQAFLTGETIKDVCSAFQKLSDNDDAEHGFFYDYISGLFFRHPELLESVNELRKDNGIAEI